MPASEPYTGLMKEVEALSKYEVKITLAQPYSLPAGLLPAGSLTASGVLPQPPRTDSASRDVNRNAAVLFHFFILQCLLNFVFINPQRERRNAPLSQVAQEFTMLLEQWYRNEIDEDLFCEGLTQRFHISCEGPPVLVTVHNAGVLLEHFPCDMIFTFANDGFTCGSLLCGILYQKYRPIGLRIEYYDGAGDQARTMVADQTAEVGLVRVWSCYKKIELRLQAEDGQGERGLRHIQVGGRFVDGACFFYLQYVFLR